MNWKFGVVVAIVLGLGAACLAEAQVPVGDPVIVSTTVGSEKSSPDVAAGPDGGFVVAWWARHQDGDGWGVFARWYDAAGGPLTGEVQINTVTTGNQYLRGMDADGQGGYVLVWEDAARGVVARRFDSAGVAMGDETLVVASDLIVDAAVSANSDGNYVVTWLRLDPPHKIIEGRRFGPDGLPLGDVFTVSTYSYDSWWEETAVELLDDHSFLVVWNDGTEVYARSYDAVGDPIGDEFQVSQIDPMSFASFNLHVGSEDTGRFRILWATDINLEEYAAMTRFATHFGVLGPITDLGIPTNGRPGFSMTGEGEFVVTRVTYFGTRLGAARFNAVPHMLSEFEITPELTYDLWISNVAHTGSDSLEFVAVWVNAPQPGEPFPDIMARRFIPIFADGFESGDTSVWSASIP